jgi:competence protein ComEC
MPTNDYSSRFSIYPMLWLAAAFSVGICAAYFLKPELFILVAVCFATAIVAFAFRGKRPAGVFVLIAFIAAGAICFESEQQIAGAANRLRIIYDEGRIRSGEPVEIEGILLGRPEPAFDGLILRLNARSIAYKGTDQNIAGVIRITAPIENEEAGAAYDSLDLAYGSQIRVACKPEREEGFQNPGVFSRREMLDQQGVDAVCTLKSPLLVEKLGDESVFIPLAWVYDQRRNMIDSFHERFSTATAGIMIASLLGDKHFLDKGTADIFREGGTFHILVISGLHITFIGGLTLLFVRLFTRKRIWQFVVATSFLWAYTLAVGAEVPVVRASIMFTVLLFSQVIYRHGTLLNALGFCALILLVWRPNDLFTASFQLTFISVVAIVGFAFPLIEKLRAIGSWTPTAETPFPPIVPEKLKGFCEMLYWRDEIWTIEAGRQIWSANLFKEPHLRWLAAKNLQGVVIYIFEAIVVSLVVQIWLLPVLIYYFHRVSIASILLNLWVGVFIALESIAAVATVLVGGISDWLAFPLANITELLNRILLWLPGMFVENGWASFRVPIYAGPMKAIYVVYLVPVILIAAVMYRWDPFAVSSRKRQPTFGFATALLTSSVIVMAAAIIFHPLSSPKPDGRLTIDFLDVGQGDSAFIQFPNGETMLVDGGGRMSYGRDVDDGRESFEPDVPRIGEAVVSEFLWEKGYSRVDHIVATHADTDHVQGLADVVRNFSVGTIYVGMLPDGPSEMDELVREAARRGVNPTRIGRVDKLEIGGAKIEVLWPTKGVVNTASDNNNSTVLRIVYGQHSFLFTGDIERQAEAALVANGTVLNANVIKVPHHGSRTSSTEVFIDAVKARTAVISVGNRSMFGHPNADVVERWRRSGAETMTTGSKGTVTVSTDGRNLEISQFKP